MAEYLAAYGGELLAGAAFAGVGKLAGAAYKYFNKSATKKYGIDWPKQMSANQINRLTDVAVARTKRRQCFQKKSKKWYKRKTTNKRKTQKRKYKRKK